jgi:hypothetical protein
MVAHCPHLRDTYASWIASVWRCSAIHAVRPVHFCLLVYGWMYEALRKRTPVP